MTQGLEPLATRGAPEVDGAPTMHARAVVLQPRTAFGRLLLGAVVVGSAALLLTVGLAIVLALATAAVVTGVGVVAYRAVSGAKSAPPARLDPDNSAPPARLDPGKEVFPVQKS